VPELTDIAFSPTDTAGEIAEKLAQLTAMMQERVRFGEVRVGDTTKLDHGGKVTVGSFKMAEGARADKVFTSDADGDASWEDAAYAGKTGWEVTAAGTPTVTIAVSTRTVTLSTVSADVGYWVNGIKYTLSINKTVEFADTEGTWYIYLVGDTLTAAQTRWGFDGTKCFVCSLYWDATNNEVVGGVLNQLHSWQVSERLHEYLHETFGTRWDEGLGVSDGGSDDLNVAAGELFDEDIEVNVTDDAGSGTWDQTLTPLDARILYRTGASGNWRQFASSAVPVYLDTNVLQINDPNGGGAGVWGWTAIGVNKYCAYWVLAGTAQGEPVFIVPGQEEGGTLNDATGGNAINDMAFGNLPVLEHKVVARVIIKRIAGSPYYSIEQIDDYRSVADEPKSGGGAGISDHGVLSGLSDDDHTQYVLVDGTRSLAYLEVDGQADFHDDVVIDGELKGARVCFDGFENAGRSASRYLDLNNGAIMTADRGYTMMHDGSLIGISGCGEVASYSGGAELHIEARINGVEIGSADLTSDSGSPGGKDRLDGTGHKAWFITGDRGLITFNAGDVLTLYMNFVGTVEFQYFGGVAEVQFDT
jgi:hypothetical protein